MTKNFLLLFLSCSILIRAQIYTNNEVNICNSKFKLAAQENLQYKPIGKVITSIGKSFIGTEYIAHTLEIGNTETLVINLTGLDCTTFLETDLAFARCIKEKKTTFEEFQNELQKIRYRGGVIDQYPSRLNYFSDWIYDNIKKGIVKNISQEIGGEPIKFHVSFMSKHPYLYTQLKENPSLIPIIEKQEKEINHRIYYFIPKEKVHAIEGKISNGDLIAFTSNVKGLDINHVGIAVKMHDGSIHLLNAPDVGYKVQISVLPLVDYILKVKKDTGIIVLRAVEP